MVSLAALWLPIIVSALLVFVASTLVHMVLKYHQSDYTKLSNEDAVRAAILSGKPEPRQYVVPYASGPEEMKTPEWQKKYADGPNVVLNIKAPGPLSMGSSMTQWFVFILIVSALVAYVASGSILWGAPFRHVFRVVGMVAFLAYGAGQIPGAVWMGKPWSIAIKELIDAVIYGAVTAAAFAWAWPRGV
jgi:hypothetical protein